MQEVYDFANEKMTKSVKSLHNEYVSMRAGKASVSLLDKVVVDYYGCPTPVQQMAAVSVSEGRNLVIQPWDVSTINAIEKAIQASDLGVNPMNDGKVIRLNFPPLTEEKRKLLAKEVGKYAEEAKVAALKPDILAHIDLIKKLNANGEFFDEESPRYKAAALKALQAAKDNDCLLEVNTGGVYRGYRKDFYPGAWLLGEWQKMGGKVIITSDSHDINSLTFGFDEAAAAIKAAGFTSVQVLTGNGFETQEL